MGFFETVLGAGVIPAILIILALLANGTGRRQLNKVILGLIGIELKVNGYSFKLINCMILTNMVYIVACLAKIHRLNALHNMEDEHHHHVDPFHRSEYLNNLFISYRNMLMNICSIVLIVCLNVATSQYEYYKPVKDQADRLTKAK